MAATTTTLVLLLFGLLVGINEAIYLSSSYSVAFPAEWHSWKFEHSKTYSSLHEELERHITWLSNQAYIDAYNSREDMFGFKLSMNEFGDLSDFEFQQQYRCVVPPSYSEVVSRNSTSRLMKHMKLYQKPVNLTVPESIDWRSMGAVSSVKTQGKCCSSYAFGALGSLEGAHALASGKMTELSAQNVLDCSKAYGNRGCKRGSVDNSYMYIIDNNGVDTKRSYPYSGKQSNCHFKQSTIGASMSYFVQVENGEEDDLEAALATQGPISVLIDASHNIFRFYKSGVLNIPNCSRTSVTQALTLIGYGVENGKKYWLVKNSWGTNWGMEGFAMMIRGRYNQCGIATHATFPSL